MLNIGKLSHRVEIQFNQPTTEDDHGNPVDNWTTEATVWAGIQPVSGGESMIGDQVTPELSHNVRIRYRRNVNPGKRLRYGARVFDINGVVDEGEANRTLLLRCTERAGVAL